MTLEIVLLIATILVAVAAVIVSLLQAVLERRRSGRSRAQGRPREMDAGRLGRAVPPPNTLADPAQPRLAEARDPVPVMALLIPPEPPPFTHPPVPVTADVEVASVPATTLPAAPAVAFPPPTSPLAKRKRGTIAAASASAVAASAPAAWHEGDPTSPELVTDPELAYRIGVPGAQRPSRPAVLVVADGERRAVSVSGTVATESWPGPPRHRRRAAFRVAAAATALASVMTAVIVLPDLGQQGGVLSETGRPEISSDPGDVALETPAPTPPAVTAEPTASPTPQPTPTPAPTAAPSPSPSPPTASSAGVKVASTTPQPRDTPRPPTNPTQKPSTPTPRPTRTPTPTPVPSPVALFHCTSDGLTLTLECDGTESGDATSYLWDFGDGGSSTEASPSHPYQRPGSYNVKLTVSNSAGSNENDQPFIVP